MAKRWRVLHTAKTMKTMEAMKCIAEASRKWEEATKEATKADTGCQQVRRRRNADVGRSEKEI